MTLLERYGWNNFYQQHFNDLQQQEALPGRVTCVKGFKYDVITLHGEKETELAGKLLYSATAEELPKTGDWVCLLDNGDTGYIIHVLPRRNSLTRKNPGPGVAKQVLAANVDYALIVQGLDRDFNIIRLERYIVQVLACGITPIIVLNKSDLVQDFTLHEAEIKKLNRDCCTIICSTLLGTGLETLRNSFKPAKTYMLIGSSGVGKSSLLNALITADVQKTGALSDFNHKGKHTTSTRNLFLMANQSLLIDTPGMREFGLTAEMMEDDTSLFPFLIQLGNKCRYNNCAHQGEQGCAIAQALQDGTLDRQHYENYLKLMKEQKRFETDVNDQKRLNRKGGKMSRQANEHRKKFKY